MAVPSDATDVPLDGVVRILARTCRALGDAGEPQAASRLAAEAWVLLRHGQPVQAERLNGAMHYLARLEAQIEPATPPEGHLHDHDDT